MTGIYITLTFLCLAVVWQQYQIARLNNTFLQSLAISNTTILNLIQSIEQIAKGDENDRTP